MLAGNMRRTARRGFNQNKPPPTPRDVKGGGGGREGRGGWEANTKGVATWWGGQTTRRMIHFGEMRRARR